MLFNSSKKEPLKTETVTINSDHQEVVLNWVLNDTETIYKGDYFVGYIKDETFALSPFERSYENSDIMSTITHLNIEKIRVDDHSDSTLFDLNDVQFLEESTGLNLDISVYDDYTAVSYTHLTLPTIYSV